MQILTSGKSVAADLTAAPLNTVTCCAVIVHYRCLADLRTCVASLRTHTPELPVVIVENGSDDGSFAALTAEFQDSPGIHILESARNLGFGAGCNLGIESALARFPDLRHILLLNPDTVVTEGFLLAMQATAERHRAGIVGGHIVDLATGDTWFENGKIRPWTLTRCHVPARAGLREFETEFVTGALMLIDADMLRDGLRFDDTFFLYVEDMDLCAEVRARGRSLWVTIDAVIRHRGGGSQPESRPVLGNLRSAQLEQITRGKVYFARKRLPLMQRLVFLATALLLRPVLGLVVARGRCGFLRPYFRGLWQGLNLRTPRD